jgi:pimeloyl-ACP methyl ester carboxylesterase
MDRLAAAGHEVHALSLRGHGGSAGRDGLRSTRVRDYVRDVGRVAESLRAPPLLVGHSMGGFVVQKYLEGRSSPGALLLASVPPTGVAPLLLRMTRTDPVGVLLGNLTLSLLPVVSDTAKARRLFFSDDMPESEVAAHHALLGDEAYLGYIDMLALDLARPKAVRSPVEVLGAERDAIFPVAAVEATAEAYGTKATIFPGMAHDMMLERGWEAVADHVSRWADRYAVTSENGRGSLAA